MKTLLFEKRWIHSRKEELDEKIARREQEILDADSAIIELRKKIARQQELYSNESRRKETLLGEIKTSDVQLKSVSERESTFQSQLKGEETNFNFLTEQRKKTEEEILAANAGIKKTQDENRKLISGIEKVAQIQSLEGKSVKLIEKQQQLEKDLRQNQEKFEAEYGAISELEIALGTLLAARESQVQDIFNDYNMTLDEVREKTGTKKNPARI